MKCWTILHALICAVVKSDTGNSLTDLHSPSDYRWRKIERGVTYFNSTPPDIRENNIVTNSVADPDPNPDPPDPQVFWGSWIRIRILLSLSKYNKKNLDFYCLATSFWLFIFENDVKVPSKSNKQDNFFFYFVFSWHLEGQWWKLKHPDPHQNPDPSVRGIDPRIRIRIHIKMS